MLKTLFSIALIVFLLALAFRQIYSLIKHDIPNWKEEKERKAQEKLQNNNTDTNGDVGCPDSK